MPRLGPLEAAVMEVLWSSDGPLTVREVIDRMDGQRALAYTTVMTVLIHLYRKDMVEREPAGRAFSYRASVSREEAAAASLRDVLDASSDPRSALMHFAETASDEESTILRDGLARRSRQP